MAALTKTVDGKPLTEDQFAYVGDSSDIGTWHLPIDKDHIGAAVKMFGHEQHVPADKKAAVARRIAAKAKAAGIDTSSFEQKYCGTQHADFGNGWVEIFRAGDYGEKGRFGEDDLDRVVRNYDPETHEAPACIGHPKDDAPAYGWASRLARFGNTLAAKFREVDPEFESAVRAGRFKKRSAAFYLDDQGRIAGLRHVGFLGAMPPEVKGLKNLNFDDGGRTFTEVDFAEEEIVPETENEKTIREAVSAFFREHMPALFGGRSGAGATFTEADVKRIASDAAASATSTLQAKVTELEGKLTTQTAQFSEREKQIAGGEVRQRANDAEGRLKAAGRWIPAYAAMGLPLVFAELAKQTATVEFGEGDRKKQVTPLDLLVQFLEGLPKIVPEGRTYSGAQPGAPRTANFTEGKNVKADPNSLALNEAAEKRAKDKNISFAEALTQVAMEQPELTRAGGAVAGAV